MTAQVMNIDVAQQRPPRLTYWSSLRTVGCKLQCRGCGLGQLVGGWMRRLPRVMMSRKSGGS